MLEFIPRFRRQLHQWKSNLGSKWQSLSKSPSKVGVTEKLSSIKLNKVPKKRPKLKPSFWIGLGLGIGISGGVVGYNYAIHKLDESLPKSLDNVLTYAPKGTITIEAADGTVLQQIGEVSYDRLKIWEVPPIVLNAFLSSEDHRFYEHKGVDFLGIARAAWANFNAGQVVEGGSTITQQLARIVYLSQEVSVWRKLKEMRLAHKMEQQYSKKQILEKYLNLVYLGEGSYGIGDAAWTYFSKPVDKLNAMEAATLAGIVPAPSVYSPIKNPKLAKERRDKVLRRMQEEGFISEAEATKSINTPIKVHPSPLKRMNREAHYFTDYIQQELPKYVSPGQIKAGGLTVKTTLNPQWQKYAEETIEKGLSTYGRWQGFRQASLVSIDPRNGQIKAMVGGNDFDKNQFNRVTQAKRQPGSTFKMVVYATGIAAGFTPYRSYPDAPYVVDGYEPKNYGESYSGGSVSIAKAITSSLNVVAVRALVDIGFNPVIAMAKRMGVESELQPTYSLALGAYEVTLLEMTSAYGTLANNGVHVQAHGISRVIDSKGKVIYQSNFQPEKAIDKTSSDITTWMLRDVVNSGTGRPAQIGRPVAGKTGTSDKARDLWFIGYIPQVVTGVWLGNDNNRPTHGASTTAALFWGRFMGKATDGMPIQALSGLPNFYGRKIEVKREPVKTRRSFYRNVSKVKEEGTTLQQLQQPQEPRRRRRRRRRVVE